MIIEIPNAVTKEECFFIRNAVAPFAVNSKQTAYNRDGKTVHITRTPELQSVDRFLVNLFAKIKEEVLKYRYRPPTELGSGDSGYEYHIYAPNEVLHFHADHEFSSNEEETLLRYASVALHLNTVSDGGELVFPAQNKSVKTEEGKIVIFPPYGMFGHYTTPSKEPREVIVTWFVYEHIIAKKTRCS